MFTTAITRGARRKLAPTFSVGGSRTALKHALFRVLLEVHAPDGASTPQGNKRLFPLEIARATSSPPLLQDWLSDVEINGRIEVGLHTLANLLRKCDVPVPTASVEWLDGPWKSFNLMRRGPRTRAPQKQRLELESDFQSEQPSDPEDDQDAELEHDPDATPPCELSDEAGMIQSVFGTLIQRSGTLPRSTVAA